MLLCATLAAATGTLLWAESPKIGESAPDFSLSSIDGKMIRLGDRIGAGPVVLVVLRGHPGYQCPFCNRQVADFLRNAASFRTSRTRVMRSVPGPTRWIAAARKRVCRGKNLAGSF